MLVIDFKSESMTLTCIFLGFLFTIVVIYFAGHTFDVLVSYESFINMAADFSVGRYADTYREPILSRLFCHSYIRHSFGGLLGLLLFQISRTISIITLFPAFLITCGDEKWVSAVAIFLWVSSFFQHVYI
jgi:hypothetical protein